MEELENIKNKLEEIKTARDDIKNALTAEGETVGNDIRTFAASIPNVNKVKTVNNVSADTDKNVQLDASKINMDDTAGAKQSIKVVVENLRTDVDNISVPEYSVIETTVTAGYSKTYSLTKDGTEVGVKINIPKDLVVNKGSVKVVATAGTPYTGAIVGDKYLDIELNDPTQDHIYIPVKELVDVYTGKNNSKIHVVIGSDNSIEAQLQSGSISRTDLNQSLRNELDSIKVYNAGSGIEISEEDNTIKALTPVYILNSKDSNFISDLFDLFIDNTGENDNGAVFILYIDKYRFVINGNDINIDSNFSKVTSNIEYVSGSYLVFDIPAFMANTAQFLQRVYINPIETILDPSTITSTHNYIELPYGSRDLDVYLNGEKLLCKHGLTSPTETDEIKNNYSCYTYYDSFNNIRELHFTSDYTIDSTDKVVVRQYGVYEEYTI